MEKADEHQIFSETLEQHYEDILKTALAICIIRTKPEHMNGKVYTQVLKTRLTGNENYWKLKAQKLEEELLSVKEELIKTKFLLPSEENASSHNVEDQDTNVDMEPMECLTPPCSSESKPDEHQNSDFENNHAKFLKSIVSLWNAPQTAAMLKDTQLCSHLYTTVFQAVAVLQERIHDRCFAETSIPEYCVDSLIGVLDMETLDSPKTVESVIAFTSAIIPAIMNHKTKNNNKLSDKYSKLILRLASHKKITKLVLSMLAEQLTAFSNILRDISQDPMKLQGNLKKYNSIYYVLWCIENILLKKKDDNSLKSISKSLMTSLEDSVLHLSKAFPLFTCYIWRIGGLVSATGVGENMDVE